MKTKPNAHPVPLSRDIKDIIENFTDATGKTAQSLCSDSHSCGVFLLPDGMPVFQDLTFDQFLGLYTNSEGHVFLQPHQAVRLAAAAELNIYETTGLILKSMWELHLANGHKSDTIEKMLADSAYVSRQSRSFRPDINIICAMLDNSGSMLARSGETHQSFTMLVEEMTEKKIYLESYARAGEFFSEQKKKELEILNESDNQSMVEKFLAEKARFLKMREGIGKATWSLLEVKLYCQNLENAYNRKFGIRLLEMKEAFLELEIIRHRLQLKQSNPGLSAEEIDQLTEEFMNMKQEELRQLERDVNYSHRLFPDIFTGEQPVATAEQESKYFEECRKMVRELSRLLHPDLLTAEDLNKLSEEQTEELKELFNELMNIKEFFVFKPNQIGYNCPSLQKLQAIRIRALSIYEIAGIDSKGEMIPGYTVQEKLSYLERNNALLSARIMEIETEKDALMNDQRIKSYMAILSSHSRISRHESDLSNQLGSYREKTAAAQSEYNKLLNNDQS